MKAIVISLLTIFIALCLCGSLYAQNFEPFFIHGWGATALDVIAHETGELQEDGQEDNISVLRYTRTLDAFDGEQAEIVYFFVDNTLQLVSVDMCPVVDDLAGVKPMVMQTQNEVALHFDNPQFISKSRADKDPDATNWLSLAYIRDEHTIATLMFNWRPEDNILYSSVAFFDITTEQSKEMLQRLENSKNDPSLGWKDYGTKSD